MQINWFKKLLSESFLNSFGPDLNATDKSLAQADAVTEMTIWSVME